MTSKIQIIYRLKICDTVFQPPEALHSFNYFQKVIL